MVILQFHLEPTDSTDAIWWVDSPDVPSLYASAPRLVDVQRIALNLLEALDVKPADVRSLFAGPMGRVTPRTAWLGQPDVVLRSRTCRPRYRSPRH